MESILAGNDPVKMMIGDMPFARTVHHSTELDGICVVFEVCIRNGLTDLTKHHAALTIPLRMIMSSWKNTYIDHVKIQASACVQRASLPFYFSPTEEIIEGYGRDGLL